MNQLKLMFFEKYIDLQPHSKQILRAWFKKEKEEESICISAES